jgi:hypothetical protein
MRATTRFRFYSIGQTDNVRKIGASNVAIGSASRFTPLRQPFVGEAWLIHTGESLRVASTRWIRDNL